MFGKKFSEYIQFERWILILIAAAFVIRLALPLAGASIASTRSVSINIVLLIGLIYCSIAVYSREFCGGSSGRNWLHVLAHTVAAFIVPVFAWLVGSVILFVTKRVKKVT